MNTTMRSMALAISMSLAIAHAASGETVQYTSSPGFYPQVTSGLVQEFGTRFFPPLVETTQSSYLVPGTGPVELTYRFKYDAGVFLFSFGHYRITPELSALDLSTDAAKHAYASQALAPGNATLVFDDAFHDPSETRTVTASGGDILGFFLLPDAALEEFQDSPNLFALNGTGSATYGVPPPLRFPFFSVSEANPGALDQLMSFSGVSAVTGELTNVFAWEDLTRLSIPGNFLPSDNQFNDLIFAVEGTQVIPEPRSLNLLATSLAAVVGIVFIRRRILAACFTVLLIANAQSATAENIPIVNPSFEADVLSDGFWIDGFLTGWTVFGFTAGPQNWTDAQYPGANDFDAIQSTVPDGRNSAFIRSPLVVIQQTTHATLQPNTEYRLDFFVGDRFDCIMPNYSADLIAGTTELAFNDTEVIPANGQWLPADVTFTTGPAHPLIGEPLVIRFWAYGFTDPPGAPGLYQVGIDNVRLTAMPIPEPKALLLACLGAAVALVFLKRGIS